ncbi:hypothetical protein M8J76_013709 [Diaphorina citri]|nr:hypothetical protein M8J76_013709 [Diaphorina citri]
MIFILEKIENRKPRIDLTDSYTNIKPTQLYIRIERRIQPQSEDHCYGDILKPYYQRQRQHLYSPLGFTWSITNQSDKLIPSIYTVNCMQLTHLGDFDQAQSLFLSDLV